MGIRKRIYPDDLDRRIEKVAKKFGFEYQHIRMGRFPMKWYETYGFYSIDYVFDRFTPCSFMAKVIKGVSKTVYMLTYILLFGLWLTSIGKIVDSFLDIFRSGNNPKY